MKKLKDQGFEVLTLLQVWQEDRHDLEEDQEIHIQ